MVPRVKNWDDEGLRVSMKTDVSGAYRVPVTAKVAGVELLVWSKVTSEQPHGAPDPQFDTCGVNPAGA